MTNEAKINNFKEKLAEYDEATNELFEYQYQDGGSVTAEAALEAWRDDTRDELLMAFENAMEKK